MLAAGAAGIAVAAVIRVRRAAAPVLEKNARPVHRRRGAVRPGGGAGTPAASVHVRPRSALPLR
ncbi:hypothetical protein Acsp04_45320 [Actinomadura sp. NBRC 104425]|nr:hypothetical protein Acsp04_45320 [Actinomadura sp. NBRC 104425]